MPTSSERDQPRPEPVCPCPEEVNRHVAARIHEHRLLLGLTLQQFAKRVGVTYQQMHKYETGENRLAAGRLHVIATALGVEVGALFAGMETRPGDELTLNQKAMLGLARVFLRLPSRAQQEAFCALVRALAAPTTD